MIEKYLDVPWKDTKCGYACSDHGSWNERGFATHYVHESTTDQSNEQIYTAQDTLALSGGKADHSLHFARYGVAFMAELAKGTLPPVGECDAARPCAGGALCQDSKCVAPVGGSGGAAAAGAAGTASAGMPAAIGGGDGDQGGGGNPGATAGNGSDKPLGGAGTGGVTASAGAATARSVSALAGSSGCGCRAGGAGLPASTPGAWLLLALAGAAAVTARRRDRALRR